MTNPTLKPQRKVSFSNEEWAKVKSDARLWRLGGASTLLVLLWRNWREKGWHLDLIPEKRNRE